MPEHRIAIYRLQFDLKFAEAEIRTGMCLLGTPLLRLHGRLVYRCHRPARGEAGSPQEWQRQPHGQE